LREVRRVPVEGLPSRARISADGHVASWTVFVSGDSYTATSFSTRTSVLDLRTGKLLVKNMERFKILKDGREYRAADVNFWGVTMTADDNRFYATLGTKGRTYLVEGDLAGRTVRTLRENAECPSLSPDGTRLVFKKRVLDDWRKPWRLYVLDLATMRETALSEANNVDDQGAWLDDHTIAYALQDAGAPSTSVWSVPADGSGAPKLLVRDAFSPAPLN
jgi:Tol biopolymer transport system component